MTTEQLIAAITGPAGSVVILVGALWYMLKRMEKQDVERQKNTDALLQVVRDNTQAMTVMKSSLDMLTVEVRECSTALGKTNGVTESSKLRSQR